MPCERAHTRMSAGSLPLSRWIPEDILNEMLKYFGARLRMALSASLSNPVKRKWNQSTESQDVRGAKSQRTLDVESLQLSTRIGFHRSPQNATAPPHAKIELPIYSMIPLSADCMPSSQSELEDGRPPGGTSRSPHTKPNRKVQWLDEQGFQVTHTLDEHGLDVRFLHPIHALKSHWLFCSLLLLGSLQRHHSVSPSQTHDHLPAQFLEKEEDSLRLLNEPTTTTNYGTASSRDSCPHDLNGT
jgi:hypothetical protein